MKRRILAVVAVVFLFSFGLASYLFWAMGRAEFWESSIREFERSDQSHPPKSGIIVFTGSSSIRFWKTLSEDMKPLEVINRGFGGSQIVHVNYFANRIIVPYRPQAVVLYAGENDLSWPWSKSPERVLADFEEFVAIIHRQLPETWIYYISMKPTQLRRSNWSKLQRTNQMIEAFAKTQERVQYIDVSFAMLDPQSGPRRELLRWDGLHMSPKGYALWVSIIKPVLLTRFAPAPG